MQIEIQIYKWAQGQDSKINIPISEPNLTFPRYFQFVKINLYCIYIQKIPALYIFIYMPKMHTGNACDGIPLNHVHIYFLKQNKM